MNRRSLLKGASALAAITALPVTATAPEPNLLINSAMKISQQIGDDVDWVGLWVKARRTGIYSIEHMTNDAVRHLSFKINEPDTWQFVGFSMDKKNPTSVPG